MHMLVFLSFLLLVSSLAATDSNSSRVKRLLSNNKNCNPVTDVCLKGDLVDPSIADCSFTHSSSHPVSCTAEGNNGKVISWVVAPEKYNLCKPKTDNVKFVCGSSGSNTRCVCSDYKIHWNECRCQYWTQETPGERDQGFCTAHYLAGSSGVHHYACCNNCKKGSNVKPICDGVTYQGGSSASYCGHCGKNLGGGDLKWYFNCGDCPSQLHCQSLCNQKVSTLPGFCWKWVDCFKDCCNNVLNQTTSSKIL